MIKHKNIESLINKYNLGNILDIEKLNGSQNQVYKVLTEKDTYVIKEYSKDAISNYYYLRKRKEQLRICDILNTKGIKNITPIVYTNKKIILYKNTYYLIYKYYNLQTKNRNDITMDNIQQLALVQSKIHKLNIKSKLTCSYKYINIDIEKYLKKIYSINKELYDLANNNKEKLNDIIYKNNKYTKNMRSNLCISHNDYKLLNILWDENNPILIDFDAMGLSNPTCSLCESAFTFSNYKDYIKYDFYTEYLKTYIKEYGNIKENYLESLYVSFNGKLQWLSYMMSKNHLKNNNYIEGTISMIKELILYYDNIETFNNIYQNIIKESLQK